MLSKKCPEYKIYYEGDYSPIELAWCSYVNKEEYLKILDKYMNISEEIKSKSYVEDNKMVICYTQIITDISKFHKDLEQYEIYNKRVSFNEFKNIILNRFRRWNGDNNIFECSIFQNIVEDLILFHILSDDNIIAFYKEIYNVLFLVQSIEGEDGYLNTYDVVTYYSISGKGDFVGRQNKTT